MGLEQARQEQRKLRSVGYLACPFKNPQGKVTHPRFSPDPWEWRSQCAHPTASRVQPPRAELALQPCHWPHQGRGKASLGPVPLPRLLRGGTGASIWGFLMRAGEGKASWPAVNTWAPCLPEATAYQSFSWPPNVAVLSPEAPLGHHSKLHVSVSWIPPLPAFSCLCVPGTTPAEDTTLSESHSPRPCITGSPGSRLWR